MCGSGIPDNGLGFRVVGFRVLEFLGLGFRVWNYQGLGFRV